MLKWLLSFLLQRLLILIVLVVASAILPVASFWLVRDPLGRSSFLLGCRHGLAPFWTLLASVLIGSRFWLGREHVLAWRAAARRLPAVVPEVHGGDVPCPVRELRLRVRRHPPAAPVSNFAAPAGACSLRACGNRRPVERIRWDMVTNRSDHRRTASRRFDERGA